MNLGKMIKDARAKAGMTQRELAEEAGMKPAQVSTLERGKKQPSVESLERLAKAMDSTLSIKFLTRADIRETSRKALKAVEDMTAEFEERLRRGRTCCECGEPVSAGDVIVFATIVDRIDEQGRLWHFQLPAHRHCYTFAGVAEMGDE